MSLSLSLSQNKALSFVVNDDYATCIPVKFPQQKNQQSSPYSRE
jgi:hypothetical protein